MTEQKVGRRNRASWWKFVLSVLSYEVVGEFEGPRQLAFFSKAGRSGGLHVGIGSKEPYQIRCYRIVDRLLTFYDSIVRLGMIGSR
jgi:hypothetical protein